MTKPEGQKSNGMTNLEMTKPGRGQFVSRASFGFRYSGFVIFPAPGIDFPRSLSKGGGNRLADSAKASHTRPPARNIPPAIT